MSTSMVVGFPGGGWHDAFVPPPRRAPYFLRVWTDTVRAVRARRTDGWFWLWNVVVASFLGRAAAAATDDWRLGWWVTVSAAFVPLGVAVVGGLVGALWRNARWIYARDLVYYLIDETSLVEGASPLSEYDMAVDAIKSACLEGRLAATGRLRGTTSRRPLPRAVWKAATLDKQDLFEASGTLGRTMMTSFDGRYQAYEDVAFLWGQVRAFWPSRESSLPTRPDRPSSSGDP